MGYWLVYLDVRHLAPGGPVEITLSMHDSGCGSREMSNRPRDLQNGGREAVGGPLRMRKKQ